MIAEMLEEAGDKTEILAREVGTWAGFHDSEYTHILTAALLEIPGCCRVGAVRSGAAYDGRAQHAGNVG